MDEARETVRRGYDHLAATYDERRSCGGRGRELVEAFAAALSPGSRVLDAGCGAGVPVAETLVDGHEVVGLDLSRGMLDRAAVNVPGARLVQGDLAGLPFPDRAFEGVVAYYSVIHVPRAQHGRVFSEFARVLRPGGRLLVVLGSEAWEGSNPDWLDGGAEMRWSFWGPERSKALLRLAGFDVVAEETVEDELGGVFEHVTARLD